MERAASGLKKIVLDAIRQAKPEQAPLLAWPVIVGRAIAGQTRALDFQDGVLRVEVPDKNWRAELAAFAPQYIAAYRQVAKVDAIDFVIAGERLAPHDAQNRRLMGTPPRPPRAPHSKG